MSKIKNKATTRERRLYPADRNGQAEYYARHFNRGKLRSDMVLNLGGYTNLKAKAKE